MKTKTADSKLELVFPVSGAESPASTDLMKQAQPPSPLGVFSGQIIGFQDGMPLVDFTGSYTTTGLSAHTCISLTPANVGRRVILAFTDNDRERPIILGLLVEPEAKDGGTLPINVQLDEEKLVLTANREIIMRCGDASITLTAAGKILVRGTYILTRSSGANRIKGAAVEIN